MIDEEEYETEPEDDSYREQFDITKICSLIRTAWKIIPNHTFTEFLNTAIPASLEEITGKEMEELLEEFIHQNM
jgi:hypothetical protein